MTLPASQGGPGGLLLLWMENPVQFVRDNFKVEPDAWQADALMSCTGMGIHRLSLQACVGPGKSAVDAWIIWWFISLFARAGAFPKAAALSNTRENLRDNLWAELHKWRNRSDYLKNQFEINAERIYQKDHAAEWFVSARGFAQTASPEEMGEALSGLHADFVLICIDESGTTHPIMLKRATQAMATAKYGLILQSGNPLSREGCLYAASIDPAWKKICVTGDPKDPRCSPRVNKVENANAIAKYGVDDPWVRANILGQFPDQSLNSLLSEKDVREAMGKHLQLWEWNWAQKRTGTDVAGYGDDRTVIFPRQGRASFPPVIMRTQDGTVIGGRLALAKSRFRSEIDTIDATGGWAGSVVDFCRLAGINLMGIVFSGKANDDRFENRRAEMHWEAAQWVKAGGAFAPAETWATLGVDLIKEATASLYFINARGKLQIEGKDQVKKRLGFSPDVWDAFVLTFAVPEQAAADRLEEVRQHQETGGTGMVAAVTRDEDPLGWSDAARGRGKAVDMLVDRNDPMVGSGFTL